ncbi:NRDE family protein [Seonamhaeicola aphaedonensis]|uniref:Transport and Golgi organization protein 2 n=1 Tax=Seonamhaeicola aphaedonensis TaxID=1461338 RepID=A0A3D9HLB4_9FLAO|nr:NRDE family protein [Seonamhaeicola aphaedonensis]RED50101.1 transport and Golgi organization protein 2 [Seonamhaeicola aphaedonensis]
MCTVTIIPQGTNNFILTSNRDEAPNRVSSSPDFYQFEGIKMLFPKDELSTGTWIGVSEKKRLVCMLNGGFEIHERKASYRKSRGLVAKDFMIAEKIISTVETYNMNDVEPFTMVLVDWNQKLKFMELVWDGEKKHFRELPIATKLWSSSTLYSEEMKQERQQWFKEFRAKNDLNAESILRFHNKAGRDNKDYGVVMDRGFVKTTSITQVIKQGDTIEMSYENLQDGTIAIKTFNLPQIVNE